MAAGQPLTIPQIQKLFAADDLPSVQEVRTALQSLKERYEGRGLELQEVASGFQFQTRAHLSPWLGKLWEERPPRYSRAFLETLSIIAYRQPVTRAEIEDIRGVAVSSSILKTLLEREWIRMVGYKDVPGKPALYGTTKIFLDYFNLKSLRALPSLAELQPLSAVEASIPVQLAFADSLEEEEEATDSGTNLEESAEESQPQKCSVA